MSFNRYLTAAFFVVQWAIPDLLKFLVILGVSFVSVMVIYEFLVSRVNLLRFLFGMKPIARRLVDQPAGSQVIEPY